MTLRTRRGGLGRADLLREGAFVIAKRTENSFTYRFYGKAEWAKSTYLLLCRGYIAQEVEAILRSGWMYEAVQQNKTPVTAASWLIEFLDHDKSFTEETVAELVRRMDSLHVRCGVKHVSPLTSNDLDCIAARKSVDDIPKLIAEINRLNAEIEITEPEPGPFYDDPEDVK